MQKPFISVPKQSKHTRTVPKIIWSLYNCKNLLVPSEALVRACSRKWAAVVGGGPGSFHSGMISPRADNCTGGGAAVGGAAERGSDNDDNIDNQGEY